jgi:DNA-binding response OmpR family regulator
LGDFDVNSLNVLLVDPDEEFASTLAERLRLRGANVRTSSSIEESLTEIEVSPPRVIIISLAFKELAGLDMIRRLKIDFPHILIVALADLGETRHMQQSLRLGAHRCLMKPFQIEELMESFDDTIRNP